MTQAACLFRLSLIRHRSRYRITAAGRVGALLSGAGAVSCYKWLLGEVPELRERGVLWWMLGQSSRTGTGWTGC